MMKGYVATSDAGQAILYRDRKRWLWMLSCMLPLQPIPGILLHARTGNEAWLLLPLAFSYLLMPILDAVVGEDENNPPEAVVPQLDADRYYRLLTYINVPLHFVVLIACTWWAATQALSWWGFVGLAVVTGMTSGLAINTGHELGHKRAAFEQLLAKLVLAVPAYGHFRVEHNRGHHLDVATAADPASSRMGESIYRFALREIPGAFFRGWRSEEDRLARRGRSAWDWRNEILQSLAVTVLLQGGLVLVLGLLAVPFLLIHNVFAWWQLTSANYIEHYGLLRKTDDNGKLERCQPYHSWNSNHLVSNLTLLHLERHSDHHAHPARRYQSLRHFDDLPALPNGYFGCYMLAWVPPLWYRVMDPRLLALTHVDGDLANVNVDPRRRTAIESRYRMPPTA